MSTQIHKNIILMFITLFVFGCMGGGNGGVMEPKEPEPFAEPVPGPGEMGNRRTNEFRATVIENKDLDKISLKEIREAGRAVFSTPFNVFDGLGDGPSNPMDLKEPGGRLTLPAYPSFGDTPGEGNKIFLRVNGLDSQTCLECHSIVDNSQVPAIFGVGGVGGVSATAFPAATKLETTNPNPPGSDAATYDGRIINPPFVFGSGGVELLAKEMTANLQAQLSQASMTPNVPIELETHGVSFGSVSWKPVEGGMKEPELAPTKTNCDQMTPETPEPADKKSLLKKLLKIKMAKLRHFIAITKAPHIYSDGKKFGTYGAMQDVQPTLELDISKLEGIGGDLVVKPFGRKGNNVTTRDFDCGAIRFHMGMEPVEIVGADVDHDGDGVKNEVTITEMSALAIFNTTTHRPRQDDYMGNGDQVFSKIGCATCHIPVMKTRGHMLPYQQPEMPQTPFEGSYYEVNLVETAGFEANPNKEGGMLVKLFSDLKRHDMGPELQESLAGTDDKANRSFITARLWGLADTAPYMHDGRATTITEAITVHGGAAEAAKQAFVSLSDDDKNALLVFLRTLRTPTLQQLEIH